MRPSLFALAAALAVPLAAPLVAPGLAAAADPASDQPPTPVADVVVTAQRLPAVLADAPDVTVIDRDQIDARQAVFATDVLNTVPGLSIADNGAFGGITTIRMRGATADKTLVLIDGVPQNDASDPNGAYDFANLDLANIERIEVLSGPQGALWGSSAIGGVIALTTRELDGWRLQGEGGQLHTWDGSAAVGKATGDWAVGGSLWGIRTDGVAKADGTAPSDPYHAWTASGYARLTPTPAVSLDLRFRYEDSLAWIAGYDANTFAFGYTPQYYTTRGWTVDGRAVVQGPLGFTDTLTIGFHNIDRADVYIGQPFVSSTYWGDTEIYRFTAERGAPGDPFAMIFGAERDSSRADISTGQTFDLGTTSGFAMARVRPIKALTLSGSVRYDAPDTFGGVATGRVAGTFKLGGGFALEGSWGQGFKTPTISEIACDFCFPVGPSANLKPEHGEGWDAGVQWRSADGGILARVTYYQLGVRDQIAFNAGFPFVYVNVGHTRTEGVEASLEARLTPHLSLEAGYAYTNAIDLDAGTQMLRVPRSSGSAALTWTQGPWQATISVRGEGEDADEDPNTFAPVTRPGFVVASLDGAYAILPNLELTARVQDIADTHYQEVFGYGEPRRMVLLGIRARG